MGDYFVASYWRSYVQAHVAHWQHKTWSGFSVRSTGVDYQQLTFGGQPLVPTNQYFIEPTFFTRLGSGALQGQFTFGLSVPTSSTPRVPYNARTAPSSLLVGVAFTLRPDLLRRRHE